MSWYIRKSVSFGPVRFNFSKSGIGTSVGVKGFRIGIKPNGKSYVHAGRGGLYYREEFGSNSNVSQNSYCHSQTDTTFYNTATSNDVKSEYKKEIVEALSNSYKAFRYDYLVGTIFILLEIVLYVSFSTLISQNLLFSFLLIIGLVGIGLFIYVAKWETKRRQVDLIYDFENDDYEYYERIISAFNKIAICEKIWSLVDSQYLSDPHQRKINAGSSNLINRSTAFVGTGRLPWVKTNITIPLLKACGRSLYFMPDGILVYDSKGVAYVNYMDVKISTSTTSFVEDYPPSDAKIIYYTWQYANKNGGPDRRFNNNREIPVCCYGKLTIDVENNQLLNLMTSQKSAPIDFESAMKSFKSHIIK